jgi:hypothetical protein
MPYSDQLSADIKEALRDYDQKSLLILQDCLKRKEQHEPLAHVEAELQRRERIRVAVGIIEDLKK